MRIAMVGTGYVGLVSGVCFAEFGFNVTCIDREEGKIAALKRGEVPIYEPGLDRLMARNVEAGRLFFTTDLPAAVAAAEAVFIAVGTPTRRGRQEADLTAVFAVADEVAPHLREQAVLVTKSTVPVGTGEKIAAQLAETIRQKRIGIASNPEFLREGSAVEDFLKPERVIVGAQEERTHDFMRRLYQPLIGAGVPLLAMDIPSAELTKYACNAFLATKVAFINEMADLCESLGGNIEQVARGMGSDSRIGAKFLQPGPGFGGSCFPKDTRAVIAMAAAQGSESPIIRTVIAENEARKTRMIHKVKHACGGRVKNRRVAVLGLTFKAGTDDVRDSAAIPLIQGLAERGASIVAYDPQGMEDAKAYLEKLPVEYAASASEALEGADCAVIVTEWNEFRMLDWPALKASMQAPVVVDLRNIYDPADMQTAGYAYFSLGRDAA